MRHLQLLCLLICRLWATDAAKSFEEFNMASGGGGRSLKADTEEEVLMLPGKLFPLDLMGGELTMHGVPVFIQERPNSGEGTGLTVWDASIVLAKYLEYAYAAKLSGASVVELGAGTGVVGIAASLLGAAEVHLTDLSYVRKNLAGSVKLNDGALKGAVHVVELDWFKPHNDFANVDLVLAADVVWVEDLIEPLVETLKLVTSKPNKHGKLPEVVLAHQTRSKSGDDKLFGLLGDAFTITEVPLDKHHPAFRNSIIHIFVLTRKAATKAEDL